MMQTYAKRKEVDQPNTYTRFAHTWYRDQLKESGQLYALTQSRTDLVALIRRTRGPSDGQIVDLKANTCTCKVFQDQGLPCSHAICAILHFKEDPDEYILPVYTSKAYTATYRGILRAVLLNSLEPD